MGRKKKEEAPKLSAREIFASLTDEQKILVDELMDVAYRAGGLGGRSNYIFASIKDETDVNGNNIEIRMKGDKEELIDLIVSIMESMAKNTTMDFEELITEARYFHYSAEEIRNEEE